jgi:hypothetical protein
VATLDTLSSRLRSEIGDTPRSFIDTFTGDGSTTRYQLSQAPVQGATLVVKVTNTTTHVTTDISSYVIIEEGVGVLTIPSAQAPINNSVITVSGQAYRYFTDSEICYYIETAFGQHAKTETSSLGSRITHLSHLPPVEEYPVVLLASSMALYTLANDAAFDINIISPDGVNIPRAERYSQLMSMVQARKEQYVELCKMLDVGMYRIEVFSLRRISRLTNRYIPIYKPQEIDDWSLPQRVMLPVPTYGDQTPESPIVVEDIEMYSGDDYSGEFGFTFDLTTYTPAAEIVLYQNSEFAQVGPVVLGKFTISKVLADGGTYPTVLQLTLPGSVTETLPKVSYYDLQLTDSNGRVKTYFGGKIYTFPQVTP